MNGDPQTQKAHCLVQIARTQAIAMFTPLSEQFSELRGVDLENWDFFVTIAGVFLVTCRLEKMGMTEAQKQPLLDVVMDDLHEYKSDALRAFDDCKVLFEREFDRLTEARLEPRLIGRMHLVCGLSRTCASRMRCRPEPKAWGCPYTRVDVDQIPLRVPRHQVAAADLAPLAIAPFGLGELPTSSAPLATLTASGFHSVNALTGPADQLRHEAQWQ